MSTENENITNKLLKPDCDNLKKIHELLLQKHHYPNRTQVDIVDKLFSDHFQSLFVHYDEDIVCNKRVDGTMGALSIPPTDEDLWIFGYGSLVWKADFPFIDKKQGYIEGYLRRFFQHSIDHRGTHDKPGRVVTLIPTQNGAGRVYGVAYRIASSQKDQVLTHLDYREKNGYQRSTLRFIEFGSGSAIDVIMYIATNDNDSFAGGNEDNLQPIADQIYTSAGPSGPNREYLYLLADAMRQLFPGVDDDHLFKLEALVKKRQNRDKVLVCEIKREIHKILSKDNFDDVLREFVDLVIICESEEFLEEMFEKADCNEK